MEREHRSAQVIRQLTDLAKKNPLHDMTACWVLGSFKRTQPLTWRLHQKHKKGEEGWHTRTRLHPTWISIPCTADPYGIGLTSSRLIRLQSNCTLPKSISLWYTFRKNLFCACLERTYRTKLSHQKTDISTLVSSQWNRLTFPFSGRGKEISPVYFKWS